MFLAKALGDNMGLVKWNKGGRWDYNDEGYHWRYCSRCSDKTEHDSSGCCECHNRAMAHRTGPRSVTIGDYTVKIYPNDAKYCSCKGFKFRKKCKHTGMAA